MSSQDEQIAQRRLHLQQLEQLGIDVYPCRFDRRHTVAELVAAHGAKSHDDLEGERPETVTSGRILAIRSFGKANFLAISDGSARIQIYIRQDSLPPLDFDIFKLLDFGDWIGVEGRLFRTKTNELTIWASRLHFLAKCLLPLPEKWHGLTDVEIRYRQRYLDLVVNPDSRRVFEVRSRVVSAIRGFMTARGYLEVETPMMQPIAGGALARPFVTHHNTLDMELYLRVAPELYLKRLVVGGLEKVFEINRNFRNEGISTQHNPEFTMMEFYQAYSDYQALMTLTEELFATVARESIGTEEVTFGDHQISLKAPFARVVAARRRPRGGRPASRPSGGRGGPAAARPRRGARGRAGRGSEAVGRRGQDRHQHLRGAMRRSSGAADVRPRLSDRGVAAVEAASRRPRHRGAVRAVHRRVRGGQRVQRAQRPGGAAAAVRSPARATAPAATWKRMRWTRTTSARSSTACRRPPAKASASTVS